MLSKKGAIKISGGTLILLLLLAIVGWWAFNSGTISLQTQQVQLSTETPTENLVDVTRSLKITVVDIYAGSVVASATVKIYQGLSLVEQGTTDSNGQLTTSNAFTSGDTLNILVTKNNSKCWYSVTVPKMSPSDVQALTYNPIKLEFFTLDTSVTIKVSDDQGNTYSNTSRTESIGTGDGTATDFSGTLSYTPIVPGSVTVTDGNETFTDNGDGTLTGSAGGSGTINYYTGAISVSFASAPSSGADISVSYTQAALLNFGSLGVSQVNLTVNGFVSTDGRGYKSSYDPLNNINWNAVLYCKLDGNGYENLSITGWDRSYTKGSAVWFAHTLADTEVTKYKVGLTYKYPGTFAFPFTVNKGGYSASSSSSMAKITLYLYAYTDPSYHEKMGSFGPDAVAMASNFVMFFATS